MYPLYFSFIIFLNPQFQNPEVTSLSLHIPRGILSCGKKCNKRCFILKSLYHIIVGCINCFYYYIMK